MISKNYIEAEIQENMEPKSAVASLLSKATSLSKNRIAELLETPPDSKMGDLAFPCFTLSKIMKKAPNQIAEELASQLKPSGAIAKITAQGPYLNFFLDKGTFSSQTVKEVLKEKDDYGKLNQKGTVMIDVFQANPYKAFHIGHIRNAVLGESIRRCIEFAGKKTVTASYSGDIGIHIARWLLYYKKYVKTKAPKKNFTKWVSQIYAKASQKAKESEEFEKEAQELNRQLDKRDPELTALWKKFRKMCYDDYEKIAKQLACKVDHWIPESICEEPGKKWVLELYNKGKLVQSEGAIGIDLKQYDLGFFICLKSDGTALYSTKDFGLLFNKNKIAKYDKSLYVIGSEQDYYLAQLFKTYEVLGISLPGMHHHISYGLVALKSGKMSSRLGNVVFYEDLRDKTVAKVLLEVQKRSPELSESEARKVSLAIALSAIKYGVLKYSNNKQVFFDWEEAMSLEGNTGPYLQYALVRANKILKKAKAKPLTQSLDLLDKPQEFELAKQISKFPDVIEKAAEAYSPHLVANYAYELAQLFSSFYEACSVIDAEAKLKGARLALVKAFAQTLKNALWLLGIEEVEVM